MSSSPVIEISGCEKTLGTHEIQATVFRLDSFAVHNGETVALTGPSGCGKSTLLNLISGMIRPDTGNISLLNRKVDQLSSSQMDSFRGTHIGFIYQTFNLLHTFSAIHNIKIGMRFGRTIPHAERHGRALELLERVGLSHRVHSKPNHLSVGERQRVAIARALANKPKVLLADEPTGALDPKTARSVFELILELCEETKCALLFVTHDLDLASRFQHQFDCRNLIQSVSTGVASS